MIKIYVLIFLHNINGILRKKKIVDGNLYIDYIISFNRCKYFFQIQIWKYPMKLYKKYFKNAKIIKEK